MGLGGDLIRDAIRKKRYKKLAALLAEEQQQPFAGKKVSELAQLLGGVGQAMPIPEHMGNNALPFSPTPTLRPDQMRQMQPPSAINAQNADAKRIRDLISSGTPEGVELGISMAVPQAAQKPFAMSVSGGYLLQNPKTGEMEFHSTGDKMPEMMNVWDPSANGGKGALVPRTREEVLKSRAPGGPDKYLAAAPPKPVIKDVWSDDGMRDSQGRMIERLFREQVDENGQVIARIPTENIRVGPQESSGEGAKMTAALRTYYMKQIDTAESNLRMYNTTRKYFSPEFLTLGGKARFKLTEFGDYLGGESGVKVAGAFLGISPDEYSDRNSFYAAAENMANQYIRSITGAQMSQYEIGRIMRAVANIRDAPGEFQAKLDFAEYIARESLAAYKAKFSEAIDAGFDPEDADMLAKEAGDNVSQSLFPEGGDFYQMAQRRSRSALPAGVH
jgi:hypothetical protein